ncbi:PREDICTED: dynein intermediate chain 2, axonemal isoform X2 [Polistes canadensis]|uniref:dynein intermediate chain 2, axonemal isoform X2 n=1 Tax=Polistes canadensis TaxID=91411 RepID=UPI000718F316|nr:PREDICTED: dynein intermediate chain 2, axonemal isoform X2 [Polistes canadensis]
MTRKLLGICNTRNVKLQFSRTCNFSELDYIKLGIQLSPALMHNNMKINTITRSTQYSKVFAAHEVNTNTVTYRNNGMYHYEGGWPKDINMKEAEQTVRYRRKIEKDELYIHTMLQLLPPMEHCILQNNVCDIYEQYFNDTEATSLIPKTFSRTVNVYRDPLSVKRQITHVSWSPDQGTRFAANYCNTDFKNTINFNPTSYIWDIENPGSPFMTLKPFCPILTLEYSSKDNNVLVGGLMTGQVAFWDIRKGCEPNEVSLINQSHRDPCDNVLWINSKTGTEFFSSSKDGQIKWWDTRKMKVPTETLVIDLEKPENQNVDQATGVSALQFEPSMSSRFMCGLENGMVISANRKGKTPSEKLAVRFEVQYGPVIGLVRNPTFIKNFLTIGDWTARIWSEDCRESCIAWTPGHRQFVMGGSWSTTRFSVFFLIKIDGTLDVWDLLIQQDTPVLSIKVCDETLTCVRPHEQGQLIAVASRNGIIYLLELSEALKINHKNDKLLLTALLDRETRREKVIEAKNREIRLKMKSLRINVDSDSMNDPSKSNNREDSKQNVLCSKDALIEQCEQDYISIIEAEKARRSAENDVELNNNDINGNEIIN